MKHQSLTTVIISGLFTLLFPLSILAQPIVFFDGDFNPANWQSIPVVSDQGTSMSAATTHSSGGNPGANHEMTFRWENAPPGPSAIYMFYRNLNANYDPAVQGPIVSVDASEDGHVIYDSAGANQITLPMRIALEQDGSVYQNLIATAPVQYAPFPADWVNVSETGLVAGNFVKISGNGPDRPDFSATGSEIHFGYIRSNSNHLPDREITTAIDNWQVTVHQHDDSDYSISKQVLDDTGSLITTAEVADQIIYRINFNNLSADNAHGVVVTDNLPENLQFIGATASQDTYPSYFLGPPAFVTWTIGSVNSMQSVTVDLRMEILAGSENSSLINQVEVTSIDPPLTAGEGAVITLAVSDGTIPPNPDPEADLEMVSVEMQDLSVTSLDSRITATFRNNGPEAAEAVVITFDYFTAIENPWKVLTPTGTIGDLMDCEDRPSQRQFYCELPVPHTFEADASAVLVMHVTRTGNISIPTLRVSATTHDPDLSNNELVEGQPAIEMGQSGTCDFSNPKECCFIATAAYGSYLEPEVRVLRNFRDDILLHSTLGRSFVAWYYKTSPPVAEVIANHESLRITVRMILTPLIYAIKYPLLVWLTLFSIFFIVLGLRRKGRVVN